MEEIIKNLRKTAARYSADEYQRFEDELGWKPWMEQFTEAGDGEVCTPAEIEGINNVIHRAWHDAHQKRFYYVERDAIKGDAAWDTFCGVFASEAEAINAAEADWRHLTPTEQSRVRITVYYAVVPGDVELDEAMDYIYEAGCGGYVVRTIEVDNA